MILLNLMLQVLNMCLPKFLFQILLYTVQFNIVLLIKLYFIGHLPETVSTR